MAEANMTAETMRTCKKKKNLYKLKPEDKSARKEKRTEIPGSCTNQEASCNESLGRQDSVFFDGMTLGISTAVQG